MPDARRDHDDAKYLIELSHGDEYPACVKALQALDRLGSHLVTHADWGCKAGVHSGWLIVELDNRTEAMMVVPPEFRHEARIVELNRFTREEITSWMDAQPTPAPHAPRQGD